MSWFTTLVLVPGDTPADAMQETVAALLAPYDRDRTVAAYPEDCVCRGTGHPAQPDPHCDGCHGTGRAWTTVNPHGHWESWTVGGGTCEHWLGPTHALRAGAAAADPAGFRRVLAGLPAQFRCPMLVSGRLAFISDHEGIGNVYSCALDGSDLRRHTDHAEFYARNASTDGTRVIYQCAGDLWLLSDEVYEDLAYARPHVSPWSLPEAAGRTVVVSSLSKSHAMPGYRFGWIAGPETLTQHLFHLLLCMLYGGPPFVQDGALPALTETLPEAMAIHTAYCRRARLLAGLLAAAPRCRLTPPEGGMFVFMDVRATGLSASDFAAALLEQEAVAVLPADGFGSSATGHLRIALTEDDATLAEAGHRIVRFAARVATALNDA